MFAPPESHPPVAVGVDGCRGGWIAAIKRPDRELALSFVPRIDDLLRNLPAEARILVDMIIGLPDRDQPQRACDQMARQALAPHGSRVFAAPPREALDAADYEEACERARTATGKAISLQAFHLIPKIRQLDNVSDARIRESHPDLVFTRLNGGHPIGASKKTPEGVAARLRALEAVLPGCHGTYLTACHHLARKFVDPDDTLDALALCAVAQDPGSLSYLPPGPPSFDARGHPMRIWY